MDNQKENMTPEMPESQEQEGYTPRPAWQVWAARFALVLFLIFVAYQILSIARGGL